MRSPHLQRGAPLESGTSRQPYPHVFARDGELIELLAPHCLAVNDSVAHVAAALAGFGVAQLVVFAAAPHLASGTLVEVLADWRRDPLPVYVVYPPNRHLSPKVRAFVDWAADLFARNPLLQAA